MDEVNSRLDRIERTLRIASWNQGVESGPDENHEPSPSEFTHTVGRSESTHTLGRSESTHTLGRSEAPVASESSAPVQVPMSKEDLDTMLYEFYLAERGGDVPDIPAASPTQNAQSPPSGLAVASESLAPVRISEEDMDDLETIAYEFYLAERRGEVPDTPAVSPTQNTERPPSSRAMGRLADAYAEHRNLGPRNSRRHNTTTSEALVALDLSSAGSVADDIPEYRKLRRRNSRRHNTTSETPVTSDSSAPIRNVQERPMLDIILEYRNLRRRKSGRHHTTSEAPVSLDLSSLDQNPQRPPREAGPGSERHVD